jgi:hypothetical protein
MLLITGKKFVALTNELQEITYHQSRLAQEGQSIAAEVGRQAFYSRITYVLVVLGLTVLAIVGAKKGWWFNN